MLSQAVFNGDRRILWIHERMDDEGKRTCEVGHRGEKVVSRGTRAWAKICLSCVASKDVLLVNLNAKPTEFQLLVNS
jgi:hypothetical protein